MKKVSLVIFILVLIVSCATVQMKKPSHDEVYNSLSENENQYFWQQFHDGNVAGVDSVIDQLENQYKKDTADLIANAHLGFAHIWALSEWQRIPNVDSNITAHAYLSYKHFAKAYRINPNDKRILGFLADAQMAYGSISQSSKLQRQGYFKGLSSIKEWPEFNKFTVGVIFSGRDPNEKFFKKSLDWQWTTLDDCYTGSIDRTNPNIKEFLSKDIGHQNLGKNRVCYNSWIAPHNIEGFFLHMGDMIVKTGDYLTAKKVYELAKFSPNYKTWAFKNELENRIRNAERNTKIFLEKNQKGFDNVFINNTGYLCISCHKMSDEDKILYKDFNWIAYFKEKDIYSINGLPQ